MGAYYSRAGSYSRSYNAKCAERAGRMPATRAAKAWGFKSARELRRWVTTNEWHHVGKYASMVYYYDVEGWISGLGGKGVFAELAGISSSLTRAGKSGVMAQIVSKVVAENLDFKNPRQPRCNRKHAFTRKEELAARHGVRFHTANGRDLSDAGAVQFAERQRAEEFQRQRARMRKEFQCRMRENLTPRNPKMAPDKSRNRRQTRLDCLAHAFGTRYNMKRIRSYLIREKLPFTLDNYKSAFDRFSPGWLCSH